MSVRDTVKQTPMYAALMAAGIPGPHGFYPAGDPGFTMIDGFTMEWSLTDAWELDVIFEGDSICGDATNTTTGASTDFELDADATHAELILSIRGMFEFAGHPLPERPRVDRATIEAAIADTPAPEPAPRSNMVVSGKPHRGKQ